MNIISRVIFLSIACVCSLSSQAQVALGTSVSHASALLEVSSNNKGFLPPRLTNAERLVLDALGAENGPATGLLIYNLDDHCLQVNTGTKVAPVWDCLGASSSSAIVLPPSGTIGAFTNCSNPNRSGQIENDIEASAGFILEYSGGNGGILPGQSVASTGVTGLTATTTGGPLSLSTGSISFTISGTASSVGTASFPITIGSVSCTVTFPVLDRFRNVELRVYAEIFTGGTTAQVGSRGRVYIANIPAGNFNFTYNGTQYNTSDLQPAGASGDQLLICDRSAGQGTGCAANPYTGRRRLDLPGGKVIEVNVPSPGTPIATNQFSLRECKSRVASTPSPCVVNTAGFNSGNGNPCVCRQ